MSGTVRSWKRLSLLSLAVLAMVAIGFLERVPRCSEIGKNLNVLLTKVTRSESFAQASCDANGLNKDLRTQISFVNCAGFF